MANMLENFGLEFFSEEEDSFMGFVAYNAEAGKAILKTFNKTLFEMNKASVGGVLPGDELYY